jgi:hypothetical protein
MPSLSGNFRYALRQIRLSPVFTATAVLTLALGIGGTTAIFTLIHAVMLRSLPVSDPGRLYRVGEGDDCCVEGGPQDQWGMFSFSLYERLKTETPEFDEVAAFQAGRGRLGVRRQGVDSIARPLRSEFVTGNYFSTLGVRAFGGRMFTPDDDKLASPPVGVLSHRVWQTTRFPILRWSARRSWRAVPSRSVGAPRIFGETLQTTLDIWIAPAGLIDGQRWSPSSGYFCVAALIGRLRPGLPLTGCPAPDRNIAAMDAK